MAHIKDKLITRKPLEAMLRQEGYVQRFLDTLTDRQLQELWFEITEETA